MDKSQFIGNFPKMFVYQSLADESDREVFKLGAIDKDGNGYYLSDLDGFVRNIGNEVGDYDLNDDGVVEYNEFALNGLFFEFDGKTGKLNFSALAALVHPDTVFYDYKMVKFAEEYLAAVGSLELVEQYYKDVGEQRGELFLKALDEYIENQDDAIFNEAVRKHIDEFIYCYENSKDLIDLDFWCDYQELLGEKITYDEYVAIDKHLDGAPADYSPADVDVVAMLREKLREHRDGLRGVDELVSDAVERSAGTCSNKGISEPDKEL